MAWCLFLFYAAAFCILIVESSVSEQKRILLNDPSYMQQQLDHFQSEIQELQVKINTQQDTINNYKQLLDSQQNAIVSEQSIVSTLQAKVKTLEEKAGKGAHFVRWGRKDCPGNFSMVYSGYAGGSDYTHTGAAAEYVCLPSDPIWGVHKDSAFSYAAFMHGAEYENAQIYGMKDTYEDVPCAVCYTPNYSTTMMIPGRTQCYPDWTEAYHGDLSAGYYDHAAASQFVCVDQNPQALDGGGTTDDNGKLFFPVSITCRPLRCPPYEQRKLLSCVVCVK